MSRQKDGEKLRPVSLSDQACEYIKTYISQHELRPGDKLPSEGELSDMLGVNRLTVRMALQRLNTLGIIETKVGEGSFVRDFSIMPYLNEIYDVYFTSASLEEICALRRLIEMESAKLMIKNGTDEDFAELKAILDEYLALEEEMLSTKSEKVFEQLFERDLDFHHQICTASKNSLFRDLFALMRPLIRRHIAMHTYTWMENPPNYFDGEEPHKLLYDALVARDWKACKKIYPYLVATS